MADPLQHRPDEPPPLWQLAPHPQKPTQELALLDAAEAMERRYGQILACLRRRPMTLGEIAAELNVADNRISGRMTELRQKGVIEITGERRRNPRCRSMAEVYRLV